ncbi:TonB-dependent receptor plug domain-containing protein [Marivirga sp. S37H4]|uniref:TonB-dependent receptor plug domain-containing protein n=1 Tax=Marivirga aurantiaca TaxID=2802615 RepID=A0A935C7N7_9BACT|nr:TonB-dependent receptor plug domain-containing protein [Marivirga aurantiaca]MBK6265014.1 TonB-dependent receptor plug domain-containing protein [Marivirga aurantiaca]
MKQIYLLVCLGVFLLLGLNSYAQSFTTQSISDSIKNHFDINPIEKVYLDFDKSSYVSGETIWFKLYSTAGYLNQLSPLSRVVYVELFDPEATLIERIKVYSDNGIGASQIDLPNELMTGKYLIRAYTNWMLDGRKEYLFNKEVNIFNLFESPAIHTGTDDSKDISISFMPEGGKLIYGIESRVAFKALGIDGYGIEISGEVYDSKGNQITTIQSSHLGMGNFSFKPSSDNTYYVTIKEEPHKKYPLPKIEESGISLYLINLPQLNDIRFKLSNKGFNDEIIHIIGHSRGLPTYAASSVINATDLTGLIPKNSFLPGVNFITVFNSQGIPLAERAFFIDSIPQIKLSVEPDKISYGLRDKVSLSINAFDDGVLTESFLSLSVTSNNDVLIDTEENDILSYLYLSSDIKGYIEAPANYFNNTYSDAWQRLDLLMMTQGWSSFDWKLILQNGNRSPDFRIEQGLSVKGELNSDIRNKPIKNGTVSYLIQDSISIFDKVKTNLDGSFVINDLFFTGKKAIVLTGKNQKDKPNVKIVIDTVRIFPQPDKALHSLSGSLSAFQAKSIKKTLQRQEIEAAYDFENNYEVLDEVTVKASKVTEQEKVNNFYGAGDYTLDVAELAISETAQHPLELVRGRVSGVRVIGSALDWKVEIRGPGSINSGTDPLILVDNVEVPLDFLNTIPARQIEMVEVYKGASAVVFGVRGANGVLAFFTKTGEGDFTTYDRDNVTTKIIQGYSEFREFYSPDYSVKSAEHVKPDKRAVLLWDPFIKTSKEGGATIEFYTSDEPMTVTLTLEGMTKSGMVARYTSSFKVESE